MEAEDWSRVERLFHSAVRLDGPERDAYLTRHCDGDGSVRCEVESLLVAFERDGGFMEEPALSLGLRALSATASELFVGTALGPYRIVRALGRGGMGEVYLAEDTRLERKVALKFLSGALVNDNWAKRRLVKEAQAVAMLDHPNICAVYGMEEADGRSFIVMQHIEGPPLTDVLRGGPPNAKTALRWATQLVGALAEAHAHGIIHRDIKPQNIMIAAGGQVKVLDFGLAKIVPPQGHSPLGAEGQRSEISQLGLIPGTVAYMSPEQLRAEKLDFRSDIFSCGTVLYEMFSRENPFARESKAETISAILTSHPPTLRSVSPQVSPEISRIIHKCLEKDRERRYPSASELLYELSNFAEGGKTRSPLYSARFILRAVAALALLVLLAVTFFALRPAPILTLAVLPISNESPDKSLEYLGDGLAESLIGRLTPLSKLRVKAFTSVAGYRGEGVDPQVVGRLLNADAVLTGKIVQQEDSLVLLTRLVRTSDGSQIWAGRHDVRPSEIFSLREDLARNVTDKLELGLGREGKLLARRPPPDPEAFRQYLLGKHYWKNRDADNLERAIKHFNEAIRLDPVYAQARAGLADSYVLLSIVPYGKTPTAEAMSKASAAAREALEIDDTLPEAHTSLGVVNLRYDWEWQEAERRFRRAIELDPNYAPAHFWYANLLLVTGRPEQAIEEGQTARNLDPFSAPSNMNLCRTLSLARQYDRAVACYDNLLKEKPDYNLARYMLGLVYQRAGRQEEATRLFESLYSKDRALAGAALGYAYGRTGRKDDARRVLSEMTELSKQRYVPPQEFAIIHIGLGENDEAFSWLEKAYQERFATLIYLTVDPLFASLHRDARYQDLVRRIKLQPPRPS